MSGVPLYYSVVEVFESVGENLDAHAGCCEDRLRVELHRRHLMSSLRFRVEGWGEVRGGVVVGAFQNPPPPTTHPQFQEAMWGVGSWRRGRGARRGGGIDFGWNCTAATGI